MISSSITTTLCVWPFDVGSRRLSLTEDELAPFLAFSLASSSGALTESLVGSDGTSESLEISIISSKLLIGRIDDGEAGRLVKPDERGDVCFDDFLGDLFT